MIFNLIFNLIEFILQLDNYKNDDTKSQIARSIIHHDEKLKNVIIDTNNRFNIYRINININFKSIDFLAFIESRQKIVARKHDRRERNFQSTYLLNFFNICSSDVNKKTSISFLNSSDINVSSIASKYEIIYL